MRVLLTIPTWNEAGIIAASLSTVSAFVDQHLAEHHVMIEVADNASTDGTGDLARQFTRVTILALAEKGKGLAIRRSWEQHLRDMDVLLFTDADLAADLTVIPSMITAITEGTADVVVGSRFIGGATVERRWHREAASRLFRLFQRLILGLPVQDAQCGLKAISAAAAQRVLPLCHERGWLFDSELLYAAKLAGLQISEVPVAWVEHRDPTRRSAITLFRDGWGFISGLFRIRFRTSFRQKDA